MADLTSQNIKDLNSSDIAAIMFAEGGAMGEANAFYAVTKKAEYYYANLGFTDIKRKEFFETFPVMKDLDCFFNRIYRLPYDWNWLSLGFGNYLLVRKEYYDKVNEAIKDILPENYSSGDLYKNWFSLVIRAIL